MSSGEFRLHSSRRAVLRGIGTAGLALAAPAIIRPAEAQEMSGMAGMKGMAKQPPAANRPGLFERALPIPAQLAGEERAGALHYRLRMAPGRTSLLADKLTPTWGFNGAYLGPTLRIPRGRSVKIDVANALNQSTTTHWHGAHVNGEMDGGPHSLIGAGETFHYAFSLDQPAATLWYHPHPDTRTGSHVFAGLAGLVYVDDPASAPPGLPSTYGADDLPLVVQDRAFNPDGTLAYMTSAMDRMGMKGDYILVNGREQPFAEVPAQWVRLRLLDGSNARVYYFGFADNREFQVIASDAGLLRRAVPVRRLLLAPGERAEIMVDLSRDQGKSLVLRSYSGEIVPSLSKTSMDSDALDRGVFDILQLRVTSPSGHRTALPPRLAEIETLRTDLPARNFTLQTTDKMNKGPAPGEDGRQRPHTAPGPGGMSLGVGGEDWFSINHQYMNPRLINAAVKLGSTEIWQFENRSEMAHPMHYHGVSFQILSVNGRPPAPEMAGWKDTVLVRHNETVRTIARFTRPASKAYPFMLHCHILEHEDNGMMNQFTVS
ncbi:MAG TPA: multicopper oxidase domain-containing protein [Acetobacteraceae bacterium]|nr:multicopper oxidase domain-containing protein [Acetobacteraceae bacterium]